VDQSIVRASTFNRVEWSYPSIGFRAAAMASSEYRPSDVRSRRSCAIT
jgi:hypothetical protein